MREGKARFEAGREAFSQGRFADALQDFQRAYELTQHPTLLFNIGAAADRLRQDEVALEAFERYLREVPDAKNHAEVAARVEVLRASLAERRAATSAAPAEELPSTPPQAPEVPPEPQASEPGSEAGPTTHRRPILPWTVTAVSAATMATGGVLLGVALKNESDVEDAAPGSRWSEVERKRDRVPTMSTTGFVLLGAGTAGLTVGLLWRYLWLHDDEPPAQLSVGLDHVTVRGTF